MNNLITNLKNLEIETLKEPRKFESKKYIKGL